MYISKIEEEENNMIHVHGWGHAVVKKERKKVKAVVNEICRRKKVKVPVQSSFLSFSLFLSFYIQVGELDTSKTTVFRKCLVRPTRREKERKWKKERKKDDNKVLL